MAKPAKKSKTKKTFPSTPEQQAVIDAILKGESLLVSALAGSGKTETLIRAVLALLKKEGKPRTLPSDRVLIAAFNVKVAHEIRERLRKSLGEDAENYGVTVKTFNGLGHSTLLANRYGSGTLEVDTRKTKKIVAFLCSTAKGLAAFKECCSTAAKQRSGGLALAQAQLAAVLDLAKVYGVTPGRIGADASVTAKLVEAAAQNAEAQSLLVPNAKLSNVLKVCLKLNCDMAKEDGLIDFNDQPYLAVTQCGHIGRRYRLVIADEVQDLNSLSLEQIKRACTDQLVLVGDRYQNIYSSMRGANFDDILKLVAAKGMKELELTTTFRCPRMVAARQTVSEGNGPLKRFVPVSTAKIGAISYPFFSVATKQTVTGGTKATAFWTFERIFKATGLDTSDKETATIIGATNADLIGAMAVLCAEKKCRLSDIASFFYRGVVYPNTVWRAAYRKNVHEPANNDKLPAAMNLFCHVTGQTPDEAASDLEACADLKKLAQARLFAGTVHVQKGLEYDTVIVVNGPSFFGQNELRYVAETRTKNNLIGVDLCMHAMTIYRPKGKLPIADRAMIAFFGSRRQAAEAKTLPKGKEWKSATLGSPSAMSKAARMNVPKNFLPKATLLGPVKL